MVMDLKKYKIGFDISGFVLFLIVMLPNFIWFAVPAPNDILRAESVTPVIDMMGSICQVLFVAALCLTINKNRNKLRLSPMLISSIAFIILYYLGWMLYYIGVSSSVVIVLLTVPPCLAFILFALDRKNIIAVVPAVCFMICHFVYGTVNFIV